MYKICMHSYMNIGEIWAKPLMNERDYTNVTCDKLLSK